MNDAIPPTQGGSGQIEAIILRDTADPTFFDAQKANMMRRPVGFALIAVGISLLLDGLYNLDNLLFIGNVTGFDSLPIYASFVVAPSLWAALLLLDGCFLLRLRGRIAQILCGLVNAPWAVGIFDLNAKLAASITFAPAYQQDFAYFALAVALVLVGAMTDAIASRKTQRRANPPGAGRLTPRAAK